MQTLRRAQTLARFVLAWFALSIGVALASPLVKPQSMELVCSTAGTVKLVATGDDDSGPSNHLLDCPLCLTGSAPPPARQSLLMQPLQLLAQALRPAAAAYITSRTAAPLLARGPPAHA